MSMNLGAYTACLHNFTLSEALDHLKSFGLTGAEVNVGGFIPSPHCPVDLLIGSKTAREDYLGIFEEKGMRLAGLNTSGNVADPAWRFVAIGEGHDVPWWSEFLSAIAKIDPEMNINIEHEDAAYDQLEGIRLGAENLIAAQSA